MTKALIEIDIVSDVVCPWCVIGFARLQQALKVLNRKVNAKLTWHPFELNPAMPEQGENLRKHLSAKYGTTLTGSIEARAMLTELGQNVNFTFNYFDEMKMLNSHQCHQLILWAKDSGKQTELAMALFELFFTHQSEFTKDNLLTVVETVELDIEQAKAILANNSLSKQVKQEEKQWQQQGVSGVPAFIFNNQSMVVGAQEVDRFVSIITELTSEEA